MENQRNVVFLRINQCEWDSLEKLKGIFDVVGRMVARDLMFPVRTCALALLGAICLLVPGQGWAQDLPKTAGETLTGKRMVLADAVKGHVTVVIVGFSKDAGDPCTDWARGLRAEAAFADVPVYEAAMLAGAPSFVRGMIKSSMRKGLSAAEQENFVILTSDERTWRDAFQVVNEKDPYVLLLAADGRVKWQGHGRVRDLIGQVKAAMKH